MLLLGSLLLVAVSVICIERDYFHKPDPTTWGNARLHCQACYKDLTTITPSNAELIGLNLTSDYWIGLRQNMSGSKFWSRWANGEPVLYQNWYPGHPVPKKKPEPQPTCPPPPPAINNTKPEAMQCPAFMKLCACLNSPEDNDDYLIWEPMAMYNTTVNCTLPGMMWCPALAKLCDCLNSTKENETFITEFTSPAPTMLPSTITSPLTISTISTISSDLEPEYIEDSCVALLSFGMWQEKQCNESLPYICYDERFYGYVKISNETQSGAILSWSEAGVNISQYRVELNGNLIANVTNGTSYQITGLDPGELYRVQVIPVKCNRDLSAQNISFYTLPEDLRNLTKISVETNVIKLSWDKSRGNKVSYLVNIQPGNSNTTCCEETCSITKLQPGQMYNFTVKAMVNGTIFGKPGYIQACTKPSKVMKLTSSNNDSFTITAMWDSPDSNSLQYRYNIILDNITQEHDFKTITLTALSAGTKYTLKVSAIVPACLEVGEVASINAYTIPMVVTNLHLSSANDSITATWDHPNGSFAFFIVNISMSENISFTTKTTTNLNYTFNSLRAAALYTVEVVTYVAKDLFPSHAVSDFIYTRPNSPGTVSVANLTNTAVCLSWGIPTNSEGVKNINYSVNYVSNFWNDTGNLNIIGNTSVVIGGLKSGSKYIYSVKVLAGTLESVPSMISQKTDSVVRRLTVSLMCSSSTQLYCMNNSIKTLVLEEMRKHIKEKFEDEIYWDLNLRN